MAEGAPSATARRVAAYRLGFSRVPASYGDAAADEALAADVAAGEAPGSGRMRDFLAGRTRFFDRVVVGAIGRGVRQIVLGAAGYDGRALRYAKSGVRWFEVDHPATQQDKRQRLARLGLAAGQVRFVAADFGRDPVADRLTAAGLDPAQPALFLLEGVAVYLDLAVIGRVLREFRQVARPGSRLAISVSRSGADPDARARFRAAVAALGEPARSALGPDQATELLARAGWQVITGDDDGAVDGTADPQAAARRERRRAAGLLLATAGPAVSAGSRRPQKPLASRRPQPFQQPTGPLSLPALLSQTLVALTIELDNEAEHRSPHRTTGYGPGEQGDGPWLVSRAMFENCLRFLTDQPRTVRELQVLARTTANLDGMRRWGYLTIDGTARRIHSGRPGPDAVLRATPRGLRAREIWLPLTGEVEQRWRDRYGAAQLDALRESLIPVARRLDPGLPDTLPILDHALFSRGPDPSLPPRPEQPDLAALPLAALLSRVLLAFALEYEAEAAVALATAASLLRVLRADGTRPRDLAALTGISTEAVSWAMGVLRRARLAAEEPGPAASRGKVVRLTPAGLREQRLHHELLAVVEDRWVQRYGRDTIGALRQATEALAVSDEGGPPPLFRALEPYPDNWRASACPPATLPYYPMVLHRGGYPDGS